MSYLPVDLYNRLLEVDTGQPMTVDHLIPQAQGGETNLENLCFACRRCNEFKGSTTVAQDPLSDEFVPLYSPRQQNWDDHFQWDESGAIIVGLSAVGRATIIALNMNNPVIVDARRRWVSVGWHPPI